MAIRMNTSPFSVDWLAICILVLVHQSLCSANSEPGRRERSYLSHIRKHGEAPEPPTDQCGILNQVQSSVIQIMNSHSEYGKGIHTLHNIADSLEADISTLKAKLTDLEKRFSELEKDEHGNPPVNPTRDTDRVTPTPSRTNDPYYYKANAALTRNINYVNHAVHNLTLYVNTQQEKFLSLEKKYTTVRRKLKAASRKVDLWNKGNEVEKSREIENGDMIDHFMDKQKDINGNLLQRMQYLEENWKRMRVQSDSPYAVQNNGCPLNFVRHFMSCYKFENKTASWVDAEKHCQGLHPESHLVAIETKEEGEFLVQFRAYNREQWVSNYVWTGGTDMTQENVWVWVGSGKPLVYTNWRNGQPDNHNDDQHCIYFRADGTDARWDDWHCRAARLNFVCEINLRA